MIFSTLKVFVFKMACKRYNGIQLCEGQKYYIKYGDIYLHMGEDWMHARPGIIAQYSSPTAKGPETLAQWTITHRENGTFSICNVAKPSMCMQVQSEWRWSDSLANSMYVSEGCGTCKPALFSLKDIGNGTVSLRANNAHKFHPWIKDGFLRKPKDFGHAPMYLKFDKDPLAGVPEEQFRFIPV